MNFSLLIMSLESLKKELRSKANPVKAKTYLNFHKTGIDGYAEGEKFLGLSVPQLREIAKKYSNIKMKDIGTLLSSNIHEEKYVAVLILAYKYDKGDKDEKGGIVSFYLKNARLISGWDLVDTSASQILGDYLFNKNSNETKILKKLASSNNLWERRIAIISTYHLIKKNQFSDTIKIARILLNDNEDLIHKAVGWMLREIGKKDVKVLKEFLKKYYKNMPRTMLRYAIERFPEEKRKWYLNGAA